MVFNQYIWNLYKSSDAYKRATDEFAGGNYYRLLQKFSPEYAKSINESTYNDTIETIACYNVCEYDTPQTIEEAEYLYDAIISNDIVCDDGVLVKRNEYKMVLQLIQLYSVALSEWSDFFFPYFFMWRMRHLHKIADLFGIELPDNPKKADYKERCAYYWELCKIFYKFRQEHGLSKIDLCTFLYNFALSQVSEDESETHEPTCAWFIGGHAGGCDVYGFWQANEETKKGDVLIYYETTPVSAITHYCIAQTDGIIDPLFYYYSNTYIGVKYELPPITLDELKADVYFSSHPLVRKNFQGVNGWQLTTQDNNELNRICVSKGYSALPSLHVTQITANTVIKVERDVEKNLLEPLLNSMGLFEGRDFIRQLSIHAGRGHRVFPDYALHYSDKKNEETAEVIIEAKLEMKNNTDIENAFLQARSYAFLLQSKVIVLCDKYNLIVYQSKNKAFDRNSYKKYYWSEFENTDKYNELNKVLTF